MNRKWYIAALTVIAIAMAAAVWAQPPCGPDKGRRGPADRGGPESMVMQLLGNQELADRVGLTEAEKTSLRDLVFESEKKSIQLKAEAESAQLDLRRLMSGDAPDEAAVMEAIQKAGAARTALQMERVRQMLGVRKIIGPEKAREIRKSARKQFGERRGGPEGSRGKGRGDGSGRKGGGKGRKGDQQPPWMRDQMTAPDDME